MGAVQMIRDLGANAAHTFSGRSEEQGEDPEYLRVRLTCPQHVISACMPAQHGQCISRTPTRCGPPHRLLCSVTVS